MKHKIINIFFITIPVCFLFSSNVESIRLLSTYVGVDKCKKCHGMDSIGNQYKVWSTTSHANSYIILKYFKSKNIAKKYGISNPELDYRCLKCHTTGGGKSVVTKNEGVGCEACHGPGSRYFEFSNHVSFIDRENSYRKAIRLGMYPILGIKGIKSRERVCKHCHKNRPCMPEDREERKRKELSLSLIADLPTSMKHPIRR